MKQVAAQPLLGVHPKDHRGAPEALVLELHGGVVVRRRVPQAPRCYAYSLVFHLPDRHLHHYFIPGERRQGQSFVKCR